MQCIRRGGFDSSQDKNGCRFATSLDQNPHGSLAGRCDGKLCVDNEGIVKAFYANVQDLVHVLDKEGGMWVDHVHAGAKMIMGNLPDECQLPVKEVIVIAAQINENSYSLNALDEKHLVGLFSICGLIHQRGQMLETVSWKFEHCVILTRVKNLR